MLPTEKRLFYPWDVLCKPHDNHYIKSITDTNHKKGRDWTTYHGKPPTYKGRQTVEKRNSRQNNQKTKDKVAVINPHIPVISLNLNGLNLQIKRHRVAGWL